MFICWGEFIQCYCCKAVGPWGQVNTGHWGGRASRFSPQWFLFWGVGGWSGWGVLRGKVCFDNRRSFFYCKAVKGTLSLGKKKLYMGPKGTGENRFCELFRFLGRYSGKRTSPQSMTTLTPGKLFYFKRWHWRRILEASHWLKRKKYLDVSTRLSSFEIEYLRENAWNRVEHLEKNRGRKSRDTVPLGV